MRKKNNPEREAQLFNIAAVVGMPVRYRNDRGREIETKLRTVASVVGGHSAVVWLEGVSGCVAVNQVKFIGGDDEEFMGHPI